MREETHSSHGGGKTHLNFELKDLRPPEAAVLRAVLDFEVQMRSGLPCDEWECVAKGEQVKPTARLELTSADA
jgi:hypothetical protein